MSKSTFSSLYGGYGGVEGISSHDLVYEHTEEQFMKSDPCDTLRECFICGYTKIVGEPKDGAMFTCNNCFQARKRTFVSIRDMGELRYNEGDDTHPEIFDYINYLDDKLGLLIKSFGSIDYNLCIKEMDKFFEISRKVWDVCRRRERTIEFRPSDIIILKAWS